ncbi:MAG: hypothetical protein V6Z82_05770 [Flavobacteriales bacterium]
MPKIKVTGAAEKYGKFILITSMLLGLLALSSCRKRPDEKGKAIARVYDRYLYSSELRKVVPRDYTREDSTAFADAFIDKWARRQLLLKKAELNLSKDEIKGLDKRVQDYRDDLLIDIYSRYLSEKNVDTSVSESQVEAYYNRYPQSFNLSEDLVQMRYVILPRRSDKLKEAKRLFYATDSASRSDLASFAFQNAIGYSLNDTIWLKWRDIRTKFSPGLKWRQIALKKDKNFEWTDSLHVYLGRIKAVRRQGARTPMAYARPLIKKLIRNRRRLEYMKKTGGDLLNYATRNKNFEKYD